MTDPIDTIRRLDPLGSTPPAVSTQTKHALAEAVMTSEAEPTAATPTLPRPRRPVRRLALAGAVAAAGALLVTVSPWNPSSRALAFSNEDGDIVVRVLDVNAAAEEYNKEFERRGLDVEFEIIPVSPSFVGRWSGAGGHLEGTSEITYREEPAGCVPTTDDPCVPIIRIPGDFDGSATILLGRPARPGERYVIGGPVDGRNEALHGLAWRNKTVGEVEEMLAGRGYLAEFYTYGSYAKGKGRPVHHVPANWYVVDAMGGMKPGEVRLYVNDRPVR